MVKNKRLEIRISEQKKQALSVLASKEGITLSNLVDRLLSQYLLNNIKDKN